MAGGPHARLVTCDACAAVGEPCAASRVREGSETDGYTCARGHAFAVQWREVPTRPRWAVPAAEIAAAAWLRWRSRADAGLPGDPAADWLEAERALEEAGLACPTGNETGN